MQIEYENRYHRVESKHWWFIARRDLVIRLVRGASADPECRILDMGCAGGVTLQALHRDGYRHVTGIDISPEAIAQCQRIGVTNALLMDAQAPAFAPGSFDLIIASDVIEHLPEPATALRAWWRLLRPGGLVIALVPAFMFMWSPHDTANNHYRRYRAPELQDCLEAAGFRAERRCYWNWALFPPAIVVRLLQRFLPPIGTLHYDLEVPPAPLNAALAALVRAENRLLCAGVDWPWGQSALVIARRPPP
jgi:SAM-dependent methyltransferase